MTVRLKSSSPTETELDIETDTTFMGRLGELGQPVIRRKAQSTIEEFARNLSRATVGKGLGQENWRIKKDRESR